MRIPLLLFVLVLGAGLLLLAAVAQPELAQLQPHPEHPSLLQATPGAARVAPVWWIGVAFAALQIVFFGACFALGMGRGAGRQRLRREIAIGVALYAGVFALLLVSYRGFLADPSGLVLGFPAPTAVMLYLLWPAPLWFLWLYVRHFDTAAVGPAELERLRRIAREVAAEREPR